VDDSGGAWMGTGAPGAGATAGFRASSPEGVPACDSVWAEADVEVAGCWAFSSPQPGSVRATRRRARTNPAFFFELAILMRGLP